MKVFVYGTLMKSNSNHARYLSNSKFLGEAVLNNYALYNLGWYPGIKPKSAYAVKGEVFEINEETLNKLNILEGEGDLYILNKVTVQMGKDLVEDVLVYVYNHGVKEENIIAVENQPWRYGR